MIHAVSCDHSAPAPTAAGMRSEASKRKVCVVSASRVAELVDLGDEVLRVETAVRGDPAAVRGGDALGVGPLRAGEVRLERLHLGTVGEGPDELAAAEQRTLVSGQAREVEREDVAVRGHDGALRPVGRVERGLAVHVAQLVLDDRQAAVLEGRRRDRFFPSNQDRHAEKRNRNFCPLMPSKKKQQRFIATEGRLLLKGPKRFLRPSQHK